jgi:hypothetical protein
LTCNLHAILCWQNFILAKNGCYTTGLPEGAVEPSAFVIQVVGPPGGAVLPPASATRVGRLPRGAVSPLEVVGGPPVWRAVRPPRGMVGLSASTIGVVRPPAEVAGVPALRRVLIGERTDPSQIRTHNR